MGELPSKREASIGGKSVGTVSGVVTLYISNQVTDPSLKQILLYVSPFVAVVAKDWGGMLLYQLKIKAITAWQGFSLKDRKSVV